MMLKLRRRDRDRKSDRVRLEPIRQTLSTAIVSVDAELKGLAARVEDVRSRCGLLMGSEDASLFTRDADEERELRDIEAQLMSGSRRVTALRNLRRSLERLLSDVDALCLDAHADTVEFA